MVSLTGDVKSILYPPDTGEHKPEGAVIATVEGAVATDLA